MIFNDIFNRRLSTVLGAATLLSVLLTSCIIGIEDTDSGFGESFADSVEVVYRVEVSGSAFVNEVRWLEDGETRTDGFPDPEGWSRTVQAEPGSAIFLAADASADGGEARISYVATRDGEVVGQALLNCDTEFCDDFSLQDTLPE